MGNMGKEGVLVTIKPIKFEEPVLCDSSPLTNFLPCNIFLSVTKPSRIRPPPIPHIPLTSSVMFLPLLSIITLLTTHLQLVSCYTNVLGTPLETCSTSGMALTGFTRSGECIETGDDHGSHHICINLSSTSGGNFCAVTGQPDWCSSSMPCDGGTGRCPVVNWCVCQWAFSSYVANAGGCSYIQDIVCEATNIKALEAYEKRGGG